MRHVLLLLLCCVTVQVLPVAAVTNTTQEGECQYVKHVSASEQCKFVREHCTTESLLNYNVIYYCYAKPAGIVASILLQVCCVFALLLLFRVLGSTAEDFFSPILTQLSQELGLPPRLAGVTFLALGNGAPDISSSIAAVRAGQYKMALGSLLGGGMFVGCVVAGSVMLVGGGAAVRGALIRDVSAYAIAASAVALLLHSGQIGLSKACSLLVLYFLFVFVVLAADIWHRIRVVAGATEDEEVEVLPEQYVPLLQAESDSPPKAELPAMMQRAFTAQPSALSDGSATPKHGSATSMERAHSHPVRSSLVRQSSYNTLSNMNPRAYRRHAMAQLAKSETFYRRSSREEDDLQQVLGLIDESGVEREGSPDVEAPAYIPPQLPDSQLEEGSTSRQQADAADVHTSSAEAEDVQTPLPCQRASQHASLERDAPAGVSGSFSSLSVERSLDRNHDSSGNGALHSSHHQHHLQAGLVEAEDIGEQAGMWHSLTHQLARLQPIAGLFDWALDTCEVPFTVLCRGTIPIVECECYSKPWFVTSLMFGPVMVAMYLQLSWVAVLVSVAVGGGLAAGGGYALRGVEEAPKWDLGTPYPIGAAVTAAVGFVVAAMWIDTFASEVVGLVEYLGMLSGIDTAILGVTVMAWGSSIGDMATNTAMARKGLGNMAITACYAGPVFNILVGLGLGFLTWIADSKNKPKVVPVELSPAVAAGAAFVVMNAAGIIVFGLLNGNRLPPWYGKFLLVFYGVFLVLSVSLVLV